MNAEVSPSRSRSFCGLAFGFDGKALSVAMFSSFCGGIIGAFIGAMIPLLSLGVPGDSVTAILLGAYSINKNVFDVGVCVGFFTVALAVILFSIYNQHKIDKREAAARAAGKSG